MARPSRGQEGGVSSKMKDFTHKIPATTIIETIVASTIFLIILSISFTTLTNIQHLRPDVNQLLVVRNKTAEVAIKYANEPYGQYVERIGNTECLVNVSSYGQYTQVSYVQIAIPATRSRHEIECRYIIERDEIKQK